MESVEPHPVLKGIHSFEIIRMGMIESYWFMMAMIESFR